MCSLSSKCRWTVSNQANCGESGALKRNYIIKLPLIQGAPHPNPLSGPLPPFTTLISLQYYHSRLESCLLKISDDNLENMFLLKIRLFNLHGISNKLLLSAHSLHIFFKFPFTNFRKCLEFFFLKHFYFILFSFCL